MTDIKGYRWSIVIMTVYNAVFYGVKLFAQYGGSGAYILAAICTVAALALYFVLFSAMPSGSTLKKTPLKAVFGTVLALSAVLTAAAAGAYTTRLIGNAFLKKSPFPYILSLSLLPAFVGAYFGFKAISRYAYIAGHAIFFAVAVILLLTYKEYDINNLYPVFGSVSPKNMLLFPMVFSPIMYLPAISAGCGYNKGICGETAKIILISGVAVTAICFVYNLTVPKEALTLFDNPLLVVASTINFDFIFERCEALVLVIWLFLSYLNICSLVCLSSDTLTESFSLSCRNAIIWVLFAVIFAAALVADKIGKNEAFFAASSVFGGVVSVALPLCAAVFSGRKSNEK